MKVVIVEPFKKPYVKDIDSSDESLRDIVGGDLEITIPFEDMNVALIGNNLGKVLHLTPNRKIFDKSGELLDILCGTYIICAAPPDSQDFESLSDEKLKFYKDMFEKSEICIS